jgi:hypothetical protein
VTGISRRLFLAIAAALPSSAWYVRLARTRQVIELREASVFQAPYLVDRLVPGCSLTFEHRAGATYLTLDRHIVGRLPNPVETSGLSASVWSTARDDNGRLRVFVSLTGQAS